MIPNKKAQAEELPKERLRLWLKIIKVHATIENEIRRRLRSEFNSTLPRFDVMSALARFPGGLKMSEISSLLKVSNGNVTGIVDRLAEDGLVLRVAVPGDRRAQSVRLTKAGKKAFATQAAAHERWINQMLGGLDEAEIGSFNQLVEGITAYQNEWQEESDA